MRDVLISLLARLRHQYQYLKEKRGALDAWGARLTRIVSGLELVEMEKS